MQTVTYQQDKRNMQIRNDNNITPGFNEHPVEHIQKNFQRNQVNLESFASKNTFGTHFPMRLHMEQKLVSQFQRIPNLKTSYLGLEILRGDDEDIDFEDYLCDPQDEPNFPIPDIHKHMEFAMNI
eukprot:TRINITY_DN2508_c0_g1_i1.p1 TRINITY_DN2508_c0_g1~~TRINITY_DN2508_c0_g1_i1.p1  ORF type:complete len:125 (-),score=24.12 TRINITY_DN2508_c0_g1_i1:147-521(-)